MRSKVGLVVLLAIGLAATGLCAAKLIALIAAVAPYLGWSWLIALAGGAILTVAPPWALVYGLRARARWAQWTLYGYAGALVFAMRYYLPRRFTPPRVPLGQPVPAPPLSFDVQIAGLLAITVIAVALTLLLVMTAAETIAPRRVKPWMRAMLRRPPGPAT